MRLSVLSYVEKYDCMPACCAHFSYLLLALSIGSFYCEQHSESKKESKEKRELEQSDQPADAEV